MVAKISHGASLYGALHYNHEKVEKGTAEILSGNRMISDRPGLPGEDMRLALLSFENYLLANRNTEKPVLHIALSPAPEDKLTDEQRAEAASLFVHWLTEPERNLDFVAETGYMPVRNGAFDAIGDYTDFTEPQQAYQNLYAALNTMRQEYTPVSEPRFSGYYGKVNSLYDALRETQKDYPARLASGESVDELANETWTMLCSMG